MSVSDYENLVHAIAGATGGCVSMAALYPLDQVRALKQVDDPRCRGRGTAGAIMHLAKTEGMDGIYRGFASMQVALGVSNFVYFYCYQGLKTLATRTRRGAGAGGGKGGELTPLANLGVACAAGVVNVLVTAPLWRVSATLKQKQGKKKQNCEGGGGGGGCGGGGNGMVECAQQIVANEGLLGLWDGTAPSLVLVSNPVIHYFSYERLKQSVFTADPLLPWHHFVLGGLAKACATLLTYPLQVAQTELRSGKGGSGVGFVRCMADIRAAHGMAGLFRGLGAKMWQTVLTAAISLMTYEQVVRLVMVLMRFEKAKAGGGAVVVVAKAA